MSQQANTTVRAQDVQDFIVDVARLLFANAETTEATRLAVIRLSRRLGADASVLLRWGELVMQFDAGRISVIIPVEPVGVDMGRVANVLHIVDGVCDGSLQFGAARAALDAAARTPGVSTVRFGVMAAVGAAALGIIFGASDVLTLALIAFSAGAGACIRRGLGHLSHNPLIQPLCAALFAGIVGAIAGSHLVMVCPCMVLVPGPHVLNGTIDWARARIPLGAARLVFASLIVLMICSGLVLGLSIAGATLTAPATATTVPLAFDVLAAGAAVAAYGSFFNMPWKTLPAPICVGMAAHAARWVALQHGASIQTGAFIACLLVGIVISPLANRLRMPFAAFAFASVVSMIPGVLLFQVAADLVALLQTHTNMPTDLLVAATEHATTAFVIILAMTLGLIGPRMGYAWARRDAS